LNSSSIANHTGLSRIRLFLALSRTPHGLLDMATPALAALIWLGSIPPVQVVLLGLVTAFAGYTAVYALNDVVDYRIDREKIARFGLPHSSNDLDVVYVRHPLAQGLLSLHEGVLWAFAAGAIARVGAYALNPVCAFIFLAGCCAEAVYCSMLKVSSLRTIVSGGVKTAGAMAAVFAVDSSPSVLFLVLLFFWLFFWEIGGQNIPNDWSDLEEDLKMDAKTIPVGLGAEGSALLIFVTLAVANVLSLFMYWTTPAILHPLYLPGTLGAGFMLLLLPAYALYRSRSSSKAAHLFNRASYYPLCMLIIVLLSFLLRS